MIPTESKSKKTANNKATTQTSRGTSFHGKDETDLIIDGIGDPIFILDNQQLILRVNESACRLLQKKPEEIIGKHCYEIVHGIDHPLPECPAVKTLETKKVISGEIEETTLNIPLLVTTSPTFTATGEIKQITHTAKDVSKIKNAYRKIEAMNEKLNVLGSLTRHDIKNKLSVIRSSAYTIRKNSDQPKIANATFVIDQAVDQSIRILDFARMYEQLGIEELNYVDVEATINEAYQLFSEPKPALKNECRGLRVLADSSLRQLFYNFIDNTIKHGKKTTVITIHYQNSKKSLQLIYEDDGVGVKCENKSSLFKEGFSTSGSTGHGLFLIKKMTDVYGWQIEEKGKPDQGVAFVITIMQNSRAGKANYQIRRRKRT